MRYFDISFKVTWSKLSNKQSIFRLFGGAVMTSLECVLSGTLLKVCMLVDSFAVSLYSSNGMQISCR